MKKKKLACLVLSVGVVLGTLVGGCSVSKSNNDNDAMKKVESAFDNLKKLDKTYEISNVMQAPDGNLCYVEICNKDASYTEYSVDKDGNYGTVAFQDAEDTDYVLTDWVTKKDKGYLLSGDNNWVSYPDSYSKDLASRKYMYFDKMIDKLTDLKFKETTTADIGMGEESIDVYTAKVDSETVHSILGIGSEQIYKSVKEDTDNKNIKKLCEYYLDDISFTMVFSDANVRLGIVDDMLRYVQLEVGGIGSKLYYTKSVLTKEIDVRDEPDFSSTDTYESTLQQMADYVAKYDSYEEAMKALNESNEKLSGTGDTTSKPNSTEEPKSDDGSDKSTEKPKTEDSKSTDKE